jgi:HSP20 family protein
MQDLATMFNESLFGGNNNENDEESKAAPKSDDFKPEADVFDTEDSYVIHINLPGAKKEDVGVNWDAEKSELNVAGVIYRPGNEEFLKTLALDERKVGAFERKVRLGSRANPAQVDIEGITAKLEDGVLRVTVPKMNGEFVEVRKVDVE